MIRLRAVASSSSCSGDVGVCMPWKDGLQSSCANCSRVCQPAYRDRGTVLGCANLHIGTMVQF